MTQTRGGARYRWFLGLDGGKPAGPDVGEAFDAGWNARQPEIDEFQIRLAMHDGELDQHVAIESGNSGEIARLRAALTRIIGTGPVGASVGATATAMREIAREALNEQRAN